MQTVLILIHLMLVIAMIITVLLQRSEGGALGIGGGGGGGGAGGFMTGRGSANVLTRTTAILAIGFFATSMLLSILASQDGPTSILDDPTIGVPAEESPGDEAPAGEGILDEIRPDEPEGPQVPQSQ